MKACSIHIPLIWFRILTGYVAAVLITGCASSPKIDNTSEAQQVLEYPGLLPPSGHADDGSPQFTCAHGQNRKRGCAEPLLLKNDYFSNVGKEIYDFEFAHDSRPIGLSLAGGGQKAASYAIGVFRGLHGIVGPWSTENPVLESLAKDIGAVSSVSGGSYASLWYFSRLSETVDTQLRTDGKQVGFENVFSDCLPNAYIAYWEKTSLTDDLLMCPQNNHSNYLNYATGSNDPLRYQNHLRGYSDLFSKDFDYSREPTAKLTLSKEVLVTLPTIPYNLLMRLVLNWKDVRTSISANRYFRNIERTYGLAPFNFGNRAASTLEKFERYGANRNSGRGQTMAQLASTYLIARKIHHLTPDDKDMPNVPLWIANTTAETFPLGRFSSIHADLEDSVFQFTPFRFGSRHYGLWRGAPKTLDLPQIAGASGSFVDALKWTGFRRTIAAGGMSLLNIRWSFMLPNPLWQDSARTVHKLLPFPFWAVHRPGGNYRSAWIRLADGGMSENLGVFALVQRGYREIIISDHAQDSNGQFKDLCSLKANLSDRRLYLYMPDMPTFERLCDNKQSDDRSARINLWKWETPVQLGCITRDKTNHDCVHRTRDAENYYARIYLLKPALPEIVVNRATTCDVSTNDCLDGFKAVQKVLPQFPAEVFGFIVKNRAVREGDHLLFPQHSTVWLTLNSSPFLFGAYRELAAWQSAKIAKLRNCVKPIDAEIELKGFSTKPPRIRDCLNSQNPMLAKQ